MRIVVHLSLLTVATFASGGRVVAATPTGLEMRTSSVPLGVPLSEAFAAGYPLFGGLDRPSWMKLGAAPNNGTYVMFNTNGGFGLYSGQGHTLTCTAPTLYVQEGGAVDSRHILWVAGGTVANPAYGVVVLYAPDCGPPLETIANLPGQAWDVTFDRRRNAYVDIVLPPRIEVFADGHLGSAATDLVDKNAYDALSVAVDKSGDVFMGYDDTALGGHVAEFIGGRNPAFETGIATSGDQGSVAIDGAGNLVDIQYAGKYHGTNAMNVYAPPYNSTTLIASVTLPAQAVVCKFGRRGTNLYCVDQTNNTVDVYRYDSANPKGMAYLYSWPTYPASGLAPDPPFGY